MSRPVEEVNQQASVLMKRGIALLDEGTRESAAEAVKYFDEALALRRELPFATEPRLRFGLAACILNRADALARTADSSALQPALDAYAEGIEVLHGLNLADDPRYPRRLAVAHQNRGLARLARGASVAGEAAADFEVALSVLEAPEAAAIPDRTYLLGGIWTNLANTRLAQNRPDADARAVEAGRTALDIVADGEAGDPDYADTALRARHVICRALVEHLSRLPPGTPDDFVHEATDMVDEGLALVAHWERQGVTGFRGMAYELFRFGARVYAAFQPRFLEEFIAEQLDPDRSTPDYVNSPEIQTAAREAIMLTRDTTTDTTGRHDEHDA